MSISNSRDLTPTARVFALSKTAGGAFSVVLLIFQPIVFFWQVLINPSAHIPYDIEGFHLPLIAYVARCVRQGVAPLWDPYSLCGVPIHADLQAQVFYPLTWLAILAGNHSQGRNLFYWVECLVPLHMILAGLFAFLLLRKMGLGRPAALLGASVYQLGGFFASQAQHLCAICTAAWLPLAILAVFELRLRFRMRWVSVLAVAVALTILSGFAASALVVAGAMLLVVVALLIACEANWRIVPAVAAGCVLGAGIAAVELLPLWNLSHLSIAAERARWHVFGGGLPPAALVSLVLPDYYHVFEFPELYKLPYNFTFLYAYCGLAPLILILLAPFVRTARALIFFILTILGAIWMLGENTPVYRFVYLHLPALLRGALYSEYALMAFCFFAAITAALVLDRFRGHWPRALLWSLAVLTSADLIHVGAGRPMNTYRGGYRYSSSYWAPAEDTARQLSKLTGAAAPHARVDYTDGAFSQGILGAGMLSLPTPDGDNPFILLRTMHLRRLFTACQPWERQCAVSRYGSPLLNMLNVWLLGGASPLPAEEVEKTSLEPAASINGIQFYRNRRALPRFFLVPYIRRSANGAEALRLLSQLSFDPAAEAIVEGIPADRQGLATAPVRVNRYAPNRVELAVATQGPAFLVTSETIYPGWEATVNGAPRPLLTTNGAFRGLALPAGNSRIVMEYRPRSLVFGLFLSVFSLLGVLAAAVVAERDAWTFETPWGEIWAEMWLGAGRAARGLASAVAARRRTIGWAGLVFATIGVFYWKILLTSRFSLLADTDAVNRSYSRLQFWVYSIRHGVLPLWNPYDLGGHSFCAQIGNAVFYPLHLLPALVPLGREGMLSPHLYHVWFVLVHALAACFMWALGRELGLDHFAALVAGVCFSVGGFLGGTGSLDLLESGMWLPLTFLFLLRTMRAAEARVAAWNAALSGLALAMSILAGGTDTVALQALSVVSAAIYAAKGRARAALAIAGVAGSALLVSAVQVLPALFYGQRTAPPAPAELGPHSLAAMLIPGAFHSVIGQGSPASLYFGVFPLLLAIIGVWKKWHGIWVRYLAGLAIGAFLCALGSQSLFHGLLSAVLGAWWVHAAGRSVYLTGFAVSILAGFGAATVFSGGLDVESASHTDKVLRTAAIAGIAGLLLAAALGAEPARVIGFPVLLTLLSWGLFRYIVASGSGTWPRVLVVTLILFDLNALDGPLRDRREGAGTANQLDRLLSLRGAAQFVRTLPDPFRVQVEGSTPMNIGDAFGIPTGDSAGQTSADLLNVRYRLLPAPAEEPAIYQDGMWVICERPGAYPRAWIVHRAVFEPTAERQMARVDSAEFDPRQTGVVDGDVRLDPAVPNDQDWINYLKVGINRIDIDVDVKSRGLLVLSEAASPGWHATINGSSARIYRADGALRGIVLSRGTNKVVFDYSPWPVYCGGALSLGAIVALLFGRRLFVRHVQRIS